MAIVVSVVLGPRLFPPAEGAASDEAVVVAAVAPARAPAPPEPERSTSTSTTGVEPGPAPAPSTAPTTQPEPERAETEPAPAATEAKPEPEPKPPTTEAPSPTSPPTTKAPPPSTTTTTASPPPEPVAAPPIPAQSGEHGDGTQTGTVSWYDLPGSRSGVCAHRTIEKGTLVTVTNLESGESITCTVDDRGPYSGDDKVLDLHRDDFSRLAPLEQGVFPARLDW